MDVESITYILKQYRKVKSVIWEVIFDLLILISELECNSELVDNLNNTLYQLYVTKGKLVEATEELDRCIQRIQIVEAANYFRERNRK